MLALFEEARLAAACGSGPLTFTNDFARKAKARFRA
jgi:hypothetical protein